MATKKRSRARSRGPKTHRAPSKISAVTVYADRALVTRQAHLALDVGEGTIIVGGLPAALDEYSLRVASLGPAKVRLLGMKIERSMADRPAAAQLEKLRLALEKAEDERRLLSDKRTIITERLQGVKALSESAIPDLAKTLARRRMDLAEAEGVISFVYDDLTKSNAQLIKLDKALRDKDREVEKLRFEYDKVKSPQPREEKSVAVTYECAMGGEFDLALSYVMPHAGWEPTYDLYYDEAEKQTEVFYRAAVYQSSGEDWEGVKLKLSTARPQAGAAPPELEPKYVDFELAYQAPPAPAAAAPADFVKAEKAAGEEREFEAEFEGLEAEGFPPELAEAQVERAGPAVTYAVPGLPSVPADGEPHLVGVSSYRFGGELAHVVVPERAEAAYLRARAANESELAFLPGVANIFRGGEYVGRAALELTVPGAEFEYYLGADDRLLVAHDRRRVEDDSAGLTGGNRKITQRATTELENQTGAAADVVVRQRLPVPLHKDIKVKQTEAKPKPAEKDDDGRVEWHLNLKNGEKKTITFNYDVEFPNDRVVSGI
ncbi:MAG: mucoidy inhibitor MuiA family protein [Candidatus Coatesbacteria bacterium]|nr:MAG: mucoidy inhibitor MuiA family protein [Candidatus Coatesbacteria bacterium]